MSLNRFGSKTLTGEDDLEVDKINITGQGIGFNDNFGNSGQIIKKSSIDNTIEWGNEQTFSASLPIVINGGNISFNTGNAQANTIKKQTVSNLQNLYIGDTIKLQEQNGLVQCLDINTNQSNVFNSGSYKVFEGTSTLKLNISKTAFTPNSQIYEVGLSSYPIYKTHSQQLLIYDQNQVLKFSINKLGITAESNSYFIGTSSKPIHEIISTSQNIQSILYVGDLNEDFIIFTKDNINGGHQGGVSNFKHMTLTSTVSPQNFISSNGNVITTHGGDFTTYGGDLDLIRVVGGSTTYGDIINFLNITGGSDYSSSGSIITKIRKSTTRLTDGEIIALFTFNDAGPTGNFKISLNAGINRITGDGDTTIIGMDNITTSGLTTSGLALNGNLVGHNSVEMTGIESITLKSGGTGFFDTNGGDLSMSDGDIIGAGSIDCDDIVLDSDGGGNGINMNNKTIINIDGIGFVNDGDGIDMNGLAIIDVGGLSLKSGGSGIDMNGTNLTEGGTITCATINNTNAITNITIPSTITGTKIFSGSSISMTGTNVILGSSTQTQNQFSTYGYIQQLYTTSTPTTRYDYNFGLRREVKSGFPPYEDDNYASSGIQGKSYDLNLGDTNTRSYRTIKLFPSMFIVNDDQSYFNAGIYDTNLFPTTGTSAIGGIKVHTSSHELWCFVDIPEGQQMKGIYLKVSNTSGSTYYTQNIKVFKKHLGKYALNNNRRILLLDQNIPNSNFASPMTFGTLGAFAGDLVNEFDNCIAIRIHMSSNSYVLSGGYIVCEPIQDLRTKITITFSGTLQDSFGVNISQFISPHTSFGSFNMTSTTIGNQHIIYVPYTYGNEDQINLNLTSMGSHIYEATYTNATQTNDTSTSKTDWTNSNTGGTNIFKPLRQEVGIVLTQSAASTFQFVMSNSYISNITTPISVFINGKPTGAGTKLFNSGNAHTFTSSDFNYQLNTAYNLTMTNNDSSLSGNVIGFGNLVGCSMSSTSWNGNNSQAPAITFTSNTCSLTWYAET
tara:strand:+ start:2121 stop:5144 length:3024 start_codon:yes stop_codon:yes gene_type:complete